MPCAKFFADKARISRLYIKFPASFARGLRSEAAGYELSTRLCCVVLGGDVVSLVHESGLRRKQDEGYRKTALRACRLSGFLVSAIRVVRNGQRAVSGELESDVSPLSLVARGEATIRTRTHVSPCSSVERTCTYSLRHPKRLPALMPISTLCGGHAALTRPLTT